MDSIYTETDYCFHPKRDYRWSIKPTPPNNRGVVTNKLEWGSDMFELSVLLDFAMCEEWANQTEDTAKFVTLEASYRVDDEYLEQGRKVSRSNDHTNSDIFLMRRTSASATRVRIQLYDFMTTMRAGWIRPGIKLHHFRHPVVIMKVCEVPLTNR